MISTRPMIPMLTHVDNLGDINLDMTTQEQSLETIASNTGETNTRLEDIESNTFSLNSSVGTTTDAPTSNTVIGLLKSIVNKLS